MPTTKPPASLPPAARPRKPPATPPESSAAPRAESRPARRSPAGKPSPRPEPPTRQGGSAEERAGGKPKENDASHFLLVERIHRIIDRLTIPPLPNDYYLMLPKGEHLLPSGTLVGRGHGQTTHNYRALAYVGEFARLMRGGGIPHWIPAKERDAYITFIRDLLIDFLRKELEVGLMGLEQMAVDPHAELHLVAAAALRIVAREIGDNTVLGFSDRWWASDLDVSASVVTPSGIMAYAGARARSHPVSLVNAAILARITRNVPFVNPDDEETGKVSYALRAVDMLLADGDRFVGYRRDDPKPDPQFRADAMRRLSRVKLQLPMTVEVYKDRIRSHAATPPRKFHLQELFASAVEVRFGPQKNANQLLKAGMLAVVKGWAGELPPLADRPLLTARTK